MDPTVLIFLIAFAVGVGVWANAWGRNGWAWGIAAAIFSPILTAIVLVFVGKTISKKAQEHIEFNRIVEDK